MNYEQIVLTSENCFLTILMMNHFNSVKKQGVTANHMAEEHNIPTQKIYNACNYLLNEKIIFLDPNSKTKKYFLDVPQLVYVYIQDTNRYFLDTKHFLDVDIIEIKKSEICSLFVDSLNAIFRMSYSNQVEDRNIKKLYFLFFLINNSLSAQKTNKDVLIKKIIFKLKNNMNKLGELLEIENE